MKLLWRTVSTLNLKYTFYYFEKKKKLISTKTAETATTVASMLTPLAFARLAVTSCVASLSACFHNSPCCLLEAELETNPNERLKFQNYFHPSWNFFLLLLTLYQLLPLLSYKQLGSGLGFRCFFFFPQSVSLITFLLRLRCVPGSDLIWGRFGRILNRSQLQLWSRRTERRATVQPSPSQLEKM